jgi:hypothetical protein
MPKVKLAKNARSILSFRIGDMNVDVVHLHLKDAASTRDLYAPAGEERVVIRAFRTAEPHIDDRGNEGESRPD